MKTNFYLISRTVCTAIFVLICAAVWSQDCTTLDASYTTAESRCIATGVIQITAAGGSGNYNYKVDGPVSVAYTSSSIITGLSAGTYTLTVKDIISGCIVQKTNVAISGSYNDPRFSLVKTDVSCIDGADGTIGITGLQYGRSPFTFTIMAPSPSNVGATNSTGSFSNLTAGEYVIQLRDSCGGIQTRRATVLNYDWWIESHAVSQLDCDNVRVTVNLKDNRGNTNGSGSIFNSYRYAVVRSAGDTVWTSARTVDVNIGSRRIIEIIARDGCGNIKRTSWTNPAVPSVASNISTSAPACHTFTATVTGQANLTNPQYALYNSSNTLVTSNASGVFTGVAYGSYCVRITDNCYDTVITRCFTMNQARPSVAASVTADTRTCSTFRARVTSQSNLTSPQFYLHNSSNVQIQNNTTGTFTNLVYGTYSIRITDGCYDTTIVRTVSASASIPSLSSSVSITNRQCSTFDASVSSSNLTNPAFTLYNITTGTTVGTNNTGSFTNIPYGSYAIRMVNDGCYDTTIVRTLSASRAIPALNAPTFSSATCVGVTANVGGSNLSGAEYCLFDSNNNPVACNSTGVFDNLTYQNYTVRVVNGPCYDTTMTRTFTPTRPVPAYSSFDATFTCSTFTATIGTTNLLSPVYTMYDFATNQPVATNTNGVFTLPYGYYCLIVRSSVCTDTLPKQCYPVARPAAIIPNYTVSNQGCSTVTATPGSTNLTNATYSLYNASNTFITSNSSGLFNNVAYGSYTVRIVDPCYNVNTTRSFTATKPIPSVAAAVNISNKACATFTASVAGQSNLPSAQYRIYNASNNLVANNTNGIFNNLPYGDYCIRISSDCYDTTIVRCFTQLPNPVDVSVTASATCNIGTTDLQVVFGTGSSPYVIRIYGPGGNLIRTQNTNTTTTSIANLPGLPAGLQYTVIGSDACNVRDTAMVTPVVGTLNRNRSFTTRCPSGEWQNGATSFDFTASSNLGAVTPVIVRKNGAATTINYSAFSGGVYKFVDLEPATYIVAYNIQNCGNAVYDTITVNGYTYPNLQQSTAFQCDNNSFSVGASLQGGASPYTYEVIGSYPASPSIITAAQVNPVFNISNGTEYSLVRLRAIDACGNATLSDVSILPLANIVVSASSDCFYNNIALSVDTIPNATYQWYKKTSATDSVLVGNSITHNIPYLMPSDTGVYVCKTSVNSGCLTKIATFNVTGMCGNILPNKVVLSGNTSGASNQLSWTSANEAQVKEYIVERSDSKNGKFVAIGRINSGASSVSSRYNFADNNPAGEYSYYRLKIVHANDKFDYTNIVMIKQSAGVTVSVFPNPVKSTLSVYLSAKQKQNYRLELFSTTGQRLMERTYNNIQQATIQVERENRITPGVYILRITNSGNGQTNAYRVVFE